MIRTPFAQKAKEHTQSDITQRIFQELPDFREISGKSGNTDNQQHGGRKVSKLGLARLQTAFAMVIAGSTLVATTPPGPGQHSTHRRRGGPDQPSEQATHFGNSQ